MENINKIVSTLKKYNQAYRKGTPLVSDFEYDQLTEKLRRLDPLNPFLNSVEPEFFKGRKEIKHPEPMLSTEKAYDKQSLERFVARVKKEARGIGIYEPLFKLTPKFDGLAARDDGRIFATRGNGIIGYEISSAFQKGVIPVGGRGKGLGEIVIASSYFEKYLADQFEHPRNMVVGIINSDKLNQSAQKALKDKKVHFLPYSQVQYWQGNGNQLLGNYENECSRLIADVDYPVDGVVAEVIDHDVKQKMGATQHHYRWQIAIKSRGDTALTTVKGIIWQVGRTGNITPVLKVTPLSLSGATIKRVTGHHAGLIRKLRIGKGAQIEIIRSGEVIPKLENVIKPADTFHIPGTCPSCNSILYWSGDFLKCTNLQCKAQREQSISHWFKTLGNTDWLGIKTIQKIIGNDFDTLKKIYAMTEKDFLNTGFGPIQSKNLYQALNISKTKSVEDWRFLAAFGIDNLGTGDSKKLLSHIKLKNLINVQTQDIRKIHGFGEITAQSITKSIKRLQPVIEYMLSLNFNLQFTPIASDTQTHTLKNQYPLFGKKILFTGTMQDKTREQMQKHAEESGAIVQTAVTKTTDYIVCGKNPGQSKLKKAQKNNINIITETQYYQLGT